MTYLYIDIAEAAQPEGLELSLGEEGRVWAEAGGEIRGAAPDLSQDLSPTFLQVAAEQLNLFQLKIPPIDKVVRSTGYCGLILSRCS